jgi:hypothetical protein
VKCAGVPGEDARNKARGDPVSEIQKHSWGYRNGSWSAPEGRPHYRNGRIGL